MKAQCPACRKIARLPEGEAGLMTLCTACGATYTAPMSPSSKPSEPVNRGAPVTSATEAPKTERKPTVAAFWGIVGVAGCVAALLVAWGAIQWRAAGREI